MDHEESACKKLQKPIQIQKHIELDLNFKFTVEVLWHFILKSIELNLLSSP